MPELGTKIAYLGLFGLELNKKKLLSYLKSVPSNFSTISL